MDNMEIRVKELYRRVRGMVEPHAYNEEEMWTNIAVKDIIKLMEKIFPELKDKE